ncbi:Asp23/Gls24 family envelope stress response protein [Rhodococcus sp. KRD162]|uniref:Asp23/Gls24 family envelope stress response protein n=1 Tax=unclassified Rhodococcus (in: high G+C Gram-positive bacteria) TaxID=192944 RepID=UPI0019CF9F1D|nr:Asp23/Gls24 family envelope stress response protein [Rhodococcus sp. KRD162]
MTDPNTTDRDQSEDIADAVLAIDGVVGLHGGMFGEAATYLPGRRVAGIRVGDGGTEVHVTLQFGVSVRETADAVRNTVAAMIDGPVHVTVEDIVRV